jgi:hypothetical protein
LWSINNLEFQYTCRPKLGTVDASWRSPESPFLSQNENDDTPVSQRDDAGYVLALRTEEQSNTQRYG